MADRIIEQQRTELHRTIWAIANDLRGSVDGWDFKQYILGMLFYRYISENIAAYIDKGEHDAGDISLPAGLFFGASIAVYILVIRKAKTDNSVLFIDANAECVSTRDRMTTARRYPRSGRHHGAECRDRPNRRS